jgi:hypothetical protein
MKEVGIRADRANLLYPETILDALFGATRPMGIANVSHNAFNGVKAVSWCHIPKVRRCLTPRTAGSRFPEWIIMKEVRTSVNGANITYPETVWIHKST